MVYQPNQIIKQTEKLLKAFNSYHICKNMRMNLKNEIYKGINFFVVFGLMSVVILFIVNFKELKTIYT